MALFCGGAASSNCGFPLGRGTLIGGPLGERVCFAYHHWPQSSAAASVQLVAGAGFVDVGGADISVTNMLGHLGGGPCVPEATNDCNGIAEWYIGGDDRYSTC